MLRELDAEMVWERVDSPVLAATHKYPNLVWSVAMPSFDFVMSETQFHILCDVIEYNICSTLPDDLLEVAKRKQRELEERERKANGTMIYIRTPHSQQLTRESTHSLIAHTCVEDLFILVPGSEHSPNVPGSPRSPPPATSPASPSSPSSSSSSSSAVPNPQGFSLTDELWTDMHVKFQLSEFRLELLRGHSEQMGRLICYDFNMDYKTFSDQSQEVWALTPARVCFVQFSPLTREQCLAHDALAVRQLHHLRARS